MQTCTAMRAWPYLCFYTKCVYSNCVAHWHCHFATTVGVHVCLYRVMNWLTNVCCFHKHRRGREREGGWLVSWWLSLSPPAKRKVTTHLNSITLRMSVDIPNGNLPRPPPITRLYAYPWPVLTFNRTDLLSFSLLIIFTATVFLVTQWTPSRTSPSTHHDTNQHIRSIVARPASLHHNRAI